MDYKDLTAKQALEIAELKELLDEYKAMNDAIHMELYRVGGPLNDGHTAYTRIQLQPFFNISNVLVEGE